MTDFGTDVSSLDEVDETREVSGVELVAQDALWRLRTPRSSGILVIDAPDYGLDLLEAIGAISSEADAAILPDRIRAELTKDERIESVEASVVRTVEGPSAAYAIRIHCDTADGPFELVGTAGDGVLDLAVKLLPGAQ
jgi:hypothetical protein